MSNSVKCRLDNAGTHLYVLKANKYTKTLHIFLLIQLKFSLNTLILMKLI